MPDVKQDVLDVYADLIAQLSDPGFLGPKREAVFEAADVIEDAAFQKALADFEEGSAAFLDAAAKLSKVASVISNTTLRTRIEKVVSKFSEAEEEVEIEPTVEETGGGSVPDPGTGSTSSGGTIDGFDGPVIAITAEDLDALARVATSEVAIFGSFGEEQLKGGAAAVVDTIINRVAHPSSEFPDSIQAVVDKPKQFSAINPLGSWKKLPSATATFFAIIEEHVKARTASKASAILGACHFLNPNTADPSAMTAWGNHLVANKIVTYGDVDGQFVHVHGFAPGYSEPGSYAIEYAGATGYFAGDGTPLGASVSSPAPPVPVTPQPGPTEPTAPQPADGDLIPGDWLPDVKMDRIICHWTAGGHKASEHDRFCYHILIEDDGKLVRGDFSIADNVSNLVWKPRSYAAHTKSCNTRAIGVSVCCMADAKESRFKAGNSPMTEAQWKQMVRVVAELCRVYGIPVTPKTVLGHGEVQTILGRKQDGKWDPMVLPWNVALPKAQVGNLFRQEVSNLL